MSGTGGARVIILQAAGRGGAGGGGGGRSRKVMASPNDVTKYDGFLARASGLDDLCLCKEGRVEGDDDDDNGDDDDDDEGDNKAGDDLEVAVDRMCRGGLRGGGRGTGSRGWGQGGGA